MQTAVTCSTTTIAVAKVTNAERERVYLLLKLVDKGDHKRRREQKQEAKRLRVQPKDFENGNSTRPIAAAARNTVAINFNDRRRPPTHKINNSGSAANSFFHQGVIVRRIGDKSPRETNKRSGDQELLLF